MAIRKALFISKTHLREFFHGPIIILIFCSAYLFFHYLNHSAVSLQYQIHSDLNSWGYTASVFSSHLTTLVFALGSVAMFADLPLIRENSLFEVSRCTRNVWICGRLIYIFILSAIYSCSMLLLCLLTTHGNLNNIQHWDKILKTISRNISFGFDELPIETNLYITTNLTPLQSFLTVLLMCTLSSACNGILIFSVSLLCNRTFSLLLASFVAILDFAIYEGLPYALYNYSIFSFTRLSIICNPDMPHYPTIMRAIITLLLLSSFFCVLLFIGSNNKNNFSNKILSEQF